MLTGRLCGETCDEVAPVELDAAGVGLLEAGDHPQRRGLAAARGAEQREELALSDLEVEAVDGDLVAEPLHQPGQGEGAGHQAARPEQRGRRGASKLATNRSTSASVCCTEISHCSTLPHGRQERAAVVLDQPVGVAVAAVERRGSRGSCGSRSGRKDTQPLAPAVTTQPRRVVPVDDVLEAVAHPVAQTVEVRVGRRRSAPR